MLKLRLVLITMMVVILAGCNSITMPKMDDVSKTVKGTVGGAVAGAIVGAHAGGTRGAIIGGVIGGVIGNRIGSYLDEEDKKKLALLEKKALERNKASTFIARKSKAKITITPKKSKVEKSEKFAFKMPKDIVKKRLRVISKRDVEALVDTPVYSDTNEKANVQRVIKAGDNLHIEAKVAGSKRWGVLTEGNNLIGYVPLKYLKKSIVKSKRSVIKRPVKKVVPKKTVVAKNDDKNNLSTKLMAKLKSVKNMEFMEKSSNKDAITVKAEWVCKVNVIKVRPDNNKEPILEERKYCEIPPEGWKQISSLNLLKDKGVSKG